VDTLDLVRQTFGVLAIAHLRHRLSAPAVRSDRFFNLNETALAIHRTRCRHTWPSRAHTTTQVSEDPRSLGREEGHGRGDLDESERCWVVGGITVAMASGVATWLHCGRSPPGI